MEVVSLTPELEPEWERFVAGAPHASCAHALAWRNVVVRVYGLVPCHLMATDGGRACGVLPLYLVKSRLFGRLLVSAPYLSVGGVLAESGAAAEALVARARTLVATLGARYLELRNHVPAGLGLVSTDRYCSYVLPLDKDPDRLWTRLENRARTAVRKALKAGLTVDHGHHLAPELAAVLSRHMRSLGTPFHGPDFYRRMLAEFGDDAEVLLVRRGEDVVGGGIVIQIPGLLHWPFGACLATHRQLYPMNLLAWEIIRFGCLRNARALDFGRSQWRSGTALFKRQWGAEPVPLFYEFHLPPGGAVPYQDPTNPRYALPIAVWKRLPHLVTRAIGPAIIRDLP
jgi:FemAB-related protein (PEP-CTERM system-associated)